MQLTLNHLTIRPFTLNDVDDVAEYMTDAKATYFLAEGCLSKEAVIRFVTETKQAFAILHQGRQKVVGHIEFYPWFGDHTYEIGWIIHPEFQGQGIAYEAASAALAYGFVTLNLHRVVATAQPDNPASYRLMEKLGMIREGHFRQCIPRPNGQWWDEYFYSMLASDYQRHITCAPSKV